MTTIDHWLPAPHPPPRPDATELHLWLLDPERIDTDLTHLLSPDEHERAERITAGPARARFTAFRGALRLILGAYLEMPAAEIRFDYGPSGKPFLTASAPLAFNLAHAGNLGLLAITGGASIGIDLEPEQTRPNARAIARRVFPAELADILDTLDGADLQHAFLRHWTGLEAQVKREGGSVFRTPAEPVDAVHFHPRPGWLAAIAMVSAPPPEQWLCFTPSPALFDRSA